jgi:hypothetical protein
MEWESLPCSVTVHFAIVSVFLDVAASEEIPGIDMRLAFDNNLRHMSEHISMGSRGGTKH